MRLCRSTVRKSSAFPSLVDYRKEATPRLAVRGAASHIERAIAGKAELTALGGGKAAMLE